MTVLYRKYLQGSVNLSELSLLDNEMGFKNTTSNYLTDLSSNNNLIKNVNSACANNLNRTLKKIVKTDATILIMGESGTGKSKLARRIHSFSHLAAGKFVEVQCTSLPENLLESELFGHEKGAFTGAYRSKPGKVEQANGGTLFLDEIGELPLSSQAKLLRLLQEKVITRVGSNDDMKINARIILATNKNLKEMVEQGQFRRDLYYRMNIFECYLPELKKRKKDLLPLIQEFLASFQQELSIDSDFSMEPELENILLDYDWPGNIRELKNVIERLCYLADGSCLNMHDLPPYIAESRNAPTAKDTDSEEKSNSLMSFDESGVPSLAKVEKQHIQLILEREKCLEKAAQMLGITTVTLWRKRKSYNLH